jgi:integrase
MSELQVLPTDPASELEHLVDDFLHSCRARGLSPATLTRGYGYPLRRVFLPWCAANDVRKVGQLDQRTLDHFTSWLHVKDGIAGRKLTPVSIHSYSRTVSQFLGCCKQEGETVTAKPQLPRLPRRVIDVLTRTEIESMELAVPTERDKLVIRLLADTGMRVGELCTLTPDSIVRRDRRTFLKITGKSDNDRLVPLTPGWYDGLSDTCARDPWTPAARISSWVSAERITATSRR